MACFLKNENAGKRLKYQLSGFLSDTYLECTGTLLGLENFKLPPFDIASSATENLNIPDNLRLGNRLERLFSFVIKHTEAYEVLCENLQIVADKKTLGELDFILRERATNKLIHVELAGKIYLYDPALTGELSRWIGPNRKDSLQRKIQKLKDKQFPLLNHGATRNILKNQALPVAGMTQKSCFKARLFMPFHLRNEVPALVNSKNIKGYYIDKESFMNRNHKSRRYFLPEKQDWIVAPEYGEVWQTYKAILPGLEKALSQRQSPLVWQKNPDQSREAFFVVWW